MSVRSMAAALLVTLALPLSALAFVPRGGNTVVVAEQITDDLYAGGGTVEVAGEVDGDVVAAGGTVTLSGPVGGGILAAGGTVNVRGPVGRALRAAGGNVVVSGPIGTDAVLAGGNITVERAAEVGRDLVAAGGTVRVSGAVQRNAWLTGGTVTIGGTIAGNVEAQADRVVLLPTARITGSLRYGADRPLEMQAGAQVDGGITRLDRPSRPRLVMNPAARLRLRFAGRILEALWLLAIGLILVAITPRGVRHVQETVRSRFGWSLLTGFILMFIVPVAIVLLLVTLVGIPLAFAVLLLYLATLYPSQVFVSAWLGDAFLRRLGRGPGRVSPYAAVALGVILLVILVGLPVVGWIFRLLAVCAGFGALWAAIWSARGRAGPAPV
ncbi:MAG: hypothetical protein QN149_03070 [Armatimonadota bacterium]|nr:hypothetical protein [Armatimonadota bacterium]MDR7546246.1 hypothetical protein [Armatimonadota bacterium]